MLFRVFSYKLSGKSIVIGKNTTVHPFAQLSVRYGGSIVIGEGCTVHRGALIATYGGSIVLGNEISLNPYAIVYGHGGVTIGDKTSIAAHTVIIPADHNFEKRDQCFRKQGMRQQGISIGTDVWIASGVKILDGTTIEDGCVIGANAVIKGDTEPYSVYVGVPAKKIKERT